MLGIALALFTVITVLQYEKQQIIIPKNDSPVEARLGPDVPITVRPEEKRPEVNKPEKKINPNLPPEEIPNEKLDINELFNKDDVPEDEGLENIGLDDFGKNDEVETIKFVLIENMARPLKCADASSKDEQKQCFNEWIQKYLGENIKYPEMARQMHLEGKVFITFVISEKGELESAEVSLGQYEALNEEALRVVKDMPGLIPGSQQGKPVKMQMTIPVNFSLAP